MSHPSVRLATLALCGAVALSGVALVAAPAQAAAPDNDDFANAAALEGASGSLATTNVDATTEATEPLRTGGDGEPANSTVWYSWTAETDGPVQFRTANNDRDDLDTILDVYTGSAVDDLELEANDDDGGGSLYSRAVFDAVAGTTYRVRVSAFEATAQADFLLTWGEPSVESTTRIKLRKKAPVGSRPTATLVVRLGDGETARGRVFVVAFNYDGDYEKTYSKRLREGRATVKLPKLRKGENVVAASYEPGGDLIGSSDEDVVKGVKKKKKKKKRG